MSCTLLDADRFGIYLHIPYCHAKCRYCDFYSAPGCRAVPEDYVKALLRELGENHCRPDTVYFGGGTPGLLSPKQVAHLIDACQPQPNAEITLETNPELVTAEALNGFHRAGITRISFGVQSANNAQLRRLGRLHTAQDAARALAMAKDAGFAEICGDIMLALPGYSNAEFDETLALLQDGGCTHISAYLLQLEPGTPLAAHPPADLPDPDAAAAFYLYAVKRLAQAGFAQYEISNFCRPGHEGRHNLLYWNCQDYLGLGPAAHSCLAKQRRFWPSDTDGFIRGTVQEQAEGLCDSEDYLMLQLRLCAGLDTVRWRNLYNSYFSKHQLQFIIQCANHGYATWDGRILRLTPEGMVIQNSILAELI